jgi:hypothetical protein
LWDDDHIGQTKLVKERWQVPPDPRLGKPPIVKLEEAAGDRVGRQIDGQRTPIRLARDQAGAGPGDPDHLGERPSWIVEVL